MQRIRTALEQSWATRAIILAVVAVAAVFPFLPREVKLGAVFMLGWFTPALVVGAVVGWLTYSRRVWGITTGVLVALSAAVWSLGLVT